MRYADTSAQKRLKATTTKKRQFRANEYNSHINGSYGSQALVPEAAHQHVNTTNPMAHQQSVFGGRIWPRHNSNGTFMHSSPYVLLSILSGTDKLTVSEVWVKHHLLPS